MLKYTSLEGQLNIPTKLLFNKLAAAVGVWRPLSTTLAKLVAGVRVHRNSYIFLHSKDPLGSIFSGFTSLVLALCQVRNALPRAETGKNNRELVRAGIHNSLTSGPYHMTLASNNA